MVHGIWYMPLSSCQPHTPTNWATHSTTFCISFKSVPKKNSFLEMNAFYSQQSAIPLEYDISCYMVPNIIFLAVGTNIDNSIWCRYCLMLIWARYVVKSVYIKDHTWLFLQAQNPRTGSKQIILNCLLMGQQWAFHCIQTGPMGNQQAAVGTFAMLFIQLQCYTFKPISIRTFLTRFSIPMLITSDE